MLDEKQVKKNPFEILGRIASMGGAELTDRVRQGVQKRADALLFGLGIDPSREEIHAEEVGVRRFFFRNEDIPQYVILLRERLPQQAEAIIKNAEKICQHRFDLLGYKDLDYGKEIDWHLDVVHRKRAPRDLWFKIRYLDFASVGDAKVTWELNRHQHLVTLAKAYRFTDDDRFAIELLAQWRHWQKENPYPRGINWASSLEVAFRSLSWIWIYFLLEGTPAMSPEFREEWLHAMALSGRHIELYFSTYFAPNTHLLGEAVALFFIGTLYPELRSSSRWKQKGWEILQRESERQVRPDGFYFEQSTYYHVYAIDFMLHARILASLNNVTPPPGFDRRIEQMLNSLALLCQAGVPPLLGDDDGGRMFDPQRNRAEHLSDPLSTGAIVYGRGDFKFLAGGLCEETLWLLGEKGASEFERLDANPPGMSSVALPETGLYVMSCTEGRLQVVIDAGPHGSLGAAHGHADALSLTLHAGGRELLGDPGTYQYVGLEGHREYFRGTAAHNTLQLDGCDQSNSKGPFAWERLVSTDIETWVIGQNFDLFVGSHDEYSQMKNPAIHRRWVFFRKPKFWLVRDLMLGTGKHRVDLRWHLHPNLPSLAKVETQFISSGKDGGIAIIPAEEQIWSKTVEPALWSSVYGKKETATSIRFSTETYLPAEIGTVLAPRGVGIESISPQAKFVQFFPSPETSAYRLIDNHEEHYCVFSKEQKWTFEDWTSDAEFVYLCTTNGRLALLAFWNGTHVDFRGVRLASVPQRVDRCELIFSEEGIQVVSPEDGVVLSKELSRSFEIGETIPQRRGEADL